jgi:CheY-like chemotaxis protein
MTANAMVGDRERCLEAGMDDHIPKPVRMNELQRALARWLPAGAVAPLAGDA